MKTKSIRYPVLCESTRKGIKVYSIYYYEGYIEKINSQEFFIYKAEHGWFVVDLKSGCSLNNAVKSKADAIRCVEGQFDKWLALTKTKEYFKTVYNYKDLLDHSKKKMKQMTIFDY